MKTFTIENETNNIMIHGSAKEADAIPDSERFANEAALAKLATNWPAARLVEVYNSLPGVTEVKKFKDLPTVWALPTTASARNLPGASMGLRSPRGGKAIRHRGASQLR